MRIFTWTILYGAYKRHNHYDFEIFLPFQKVPRRRRLITPF